MQNMKNIIKAEKILYEYFRRDEEGNVESINTALDNIDFSVNEGQFVGIAGHNGSGKSTLAKHINALIVPEEGTVEVCGMDTKDEENQLEIRRNAGMIFQNPDNQIISSIVEEDVGFGPENLGVPSEEIIERVERALKAVDMWKYKDASPNRLSGGQKQRVAIAGVIAMNPKCIIFDESTAMLDPEGRADVLSVAHWLNKEKGVTILWITHYMEELVNADFIYVMNEGKVAATGTPREIFSDVETVHECHLALPQITELAYRLHEDGLDIPLGILSEDELEEALCHLS